jgi:hypothetical protein
MNRLSELSAADLLEQNQAIAAEMMRRLVESQNEDEPDAEVAGRWEERHTRRTYWVENELHDDIKALAADSGLSVRQCVDRLLRAGLATMQPSLV